jgi:ADP-ribosyl-[dinitrogen reductase] hydrolase
MNKGDAFELLAGEGVLRDGEWRERVLPAYTTEISDRVRGMLLGIAIGDALGNTSESMNPSERTAEYGTIRNYLPNRHAGGRAVGLPSDDSQLTFWTVEHLLETGRLDPAALMDRFATSQIYGIGRATGEAIDLYRQHGLDWKWIGARRAGNGALMRIAPVLLPHLREPTPELWLDAVLATAITHRDSAAIASSVAWVRVLWELLGADQVPEPSWWLDSFVLMVREVENPKTRYRPRGGDWAGFEGSLSDWLEYGRETILASPDVRAAGRYWYSGAYLLETVPSVIHVLARHADSAEDAIICAVNNTRDNDTVAAIVGAAVGALHGPEAFPAAWRRGLLGRTRADDDGHVFALVDEASARFAS